MLIRSLQRQKRLTMCCRHLSASSSSVNVVITDEGSENYRSNSTSQEALSAAPRFQLGKFRTGVIAKKMGMCTIYTRWGEQTFATVLHVDECQVIQVKDQLSKRGTVGMVVGSGQRKAKNVTKAMLGEFSKAGTAVKESIAEFPVDPEAILPMGTQIHARHFVPGQFVDVLGKSKGKGFQGVMKRWGFGGQPASHGVTKTHRALGSTGQCQDPGRTFKGKKMPGRMGGKRGQQRNLKVYKIDPERNLIYLQGHVPGPKGSWIHVRDALWKKPENVFPKDKVKEVPYPTFLPQEGEPELGEEFFSIPESKEDPFAFGYIV